MVNVIAQSLTMKTLLKTFSYILSKLQKMATYKHKTLLIMLPLQRYRQDLEQELVFLMSPQLENGCISFGGGTLAKEMGCILMATNMKMLSNTERSS